jgi:hypothetical protein
MVAPNTQVRLLQNVPFFNSYKHTRDFTNLEEQTNYFLSKTGHTFTDFTYQREENSIKVPVEIDELYHSNYVMYQNTAYTDKWFYGFITRKEYVNPKVTRVYFEIDVFQTWQFQIQYKPCHVVREHRTRWNTNGTPVVNTQDEGLDYGTEYETVQVAKYIPYGKVFFLVIVCSQTMHGGTADTPEITPVLNGSPQPLTYYIHPFKMDGTSPKVTLDGTLQTISPIASVLKNLYKQTDAVNNIVSLYITEYLGIDIPYSNDTLQLSMSNFDPVTIQDYENDLSMTTLYLKKISTYQIKTANLGDKYSGYTPVTESKLLMYPYTVLILDDLKGNRLELKNEYIGSPNISFSVKGSIGTTNKVAYQINDYLTSGTPDHVADIGLEFSLINNNPNDVPIITDLLSAYLQGNKNSLQNQQNQILFRGLTGAVGGLVGGIARGGLGGLGSGATEMGMSLANTYFDAQTLLAKQKDIDNTPPSISNMGGNTAFDYGNDHKGLYIIKKQITGEYRKKLTDFFKMYGYKVNELKTPSFKTREHFNYIQTLGCFLTGSIPQTDILKLQSIFDNGITIWHGDYVGDYTKINNEVV